MKFRTGLIVGIAIGYTAATWLRRDDPVIVTDPSASQGRAGRMISSSSRRVAARAQDAGLVALRRARGTIQSRLGEEQDAAWV
jgi:hypothetical protein